MADTVPPDLWLTRLEERGPSLRIAGTTYSSVALSDFMANLKASGRFKGVDLVDAKHGLRKSPRTITLEVACPFERLALAPLPRTTNAPKNPQIARRGHAFG